MQKKCLQKTHQKPSKNPEKPSKNPEKPKNQNFKKWVFANPDHYLEWRIRVGLEQC